MYVLVVVVVAAEADFPPSWPICFSLQGCFAFNIALGYALLEQNRHVQREQGLVSCFAGHSTVSIVLSRALVLRGYAGIVVPLIQLPVSLAGGVKPESAHSIVIIILASK